MFIVGAGPGIGASAARRFARGGYRVGLIARDRVRLAALVDELRAQGGDAAAVAADITQSSHLRAAIAELTQQLGEPDVLLFSALPDVSLIKPVLDTSAEDLAAASALTIGGAATAVDAVAPAMRRRAAGTLLFTTGSGALSPSA
ncbi:SDR family oxidoreductase [Allobranchiibius huperziae]|uniref:NADP-dependent 3-hydroxy acid dehydrogenase YdfG n=1 Tax=Allobranchiibius huperziae TaxID=1874116 RepID=A0A853D717_9MICO|nr:SDR family NAD(P)-dependent oxidoreductase [Allobranchiibius huperziae]NYJ73176.1 NADP-dependent 3-hydroxy acid dehydrogenase YdfG [Allobranchiibius huperziae]